MKRVRKLPKEGPSSYIVCECGRSNGDHTGAPWPYVGPGAEPKRGCPETGCMAFSGARHRWNEELYKRGEFAGTGVYAAAAQRRGLTQGVLL